MSEELNVLLNKAIAREIQVSIQYMWQHVKAPGIKGKTVAADLRRIAITEMLHAELIAERLSYLGGIPTTKPDPITVGETIKEMLELDVKAELGAIELYKRIIALAEKEKDYTTRKLFEQILSEEEAHHDTFSRYLEDFE